MTNRFKAPEIEVPEENPFEFDRLKRDEIEPTLTQLVSQLEEPFVLAIDSAFGTGKTTFIRMWRQELSNSGFTTLYFNAWQHDFVPDPMIALVGELQELQRLLKGDAASKEHLEDLTEVGKRLLKRSLPIIVRLASGGLLDIDDKTREAVEKAVTEASEDVMDRYLEKKKDLEEFREHLGRLAESLDKKPLVFLIDELDRCRPSYAVELMEQVKHTFASPGVVFVLGVDRTQLAHSVKALYGADFDAEGYLRRFIDLNYRLPRQEHSALIRAAVDAPPLSGCPSPGDFADFLTQLADRTQISLRELNQVISRLAIVVRTLPPAQHWRHHGFDAYTVGWWVCLFELSHALFGKILAGEIVTDEVVEKLKLKMDHKNRSALRDYETARFDAAFLFVSSAKSKEMPPQAAESIKSSENFREWRYDSQQAPPDFDRHEPIWDYTTNVATIFQDMWFKRSYDKTEEYVLLSKPFTNH